MGPSRVRTHPVGSGACAKLTMLEATRPGHLWLLLLCPADLAVPSVLYGSNRATHRLYANNVVMSSVESCFSRRLAQSRAETFQLWSTAARALQTLQKRTPS